MKFQYIVLTIFGIIAVVAMIVFANSDGGDKKVVALKAAGARGNVSIWGTFPPNPQLTDVFDAFNKQYKGAFSVTYRYHDPKDFDSDIVEALASGKGPDILLLPDDLIIRHSDKIAIIPTASAPPSIFQSTYIQAAEIYMRPDGVVALPFVIDPMVLYWNRDIFNNASITLPPKYWDELLVLTPQLTKRDAKTREITQSAIAFGEYQNITHAKDILAMLFLQIGNPIVKYDKDNRANAVLSKSQGGPTFVPEQDVVSAFRFFMDFSNPTKSIYTWSRAENTSLNEFIDGNLAMHLDFASSYKFIAEKNPHLNFAVAQVPQPRNTSAEVTRGRVYGLSVLKSSKNQATAFIAVKNLLSDVASSKQFAGAYNLPPIRRADLQQKPTDSAMAVFFDAAIRSRAWLDPKPDISDKAFQRMVESVSSGKENVSSATNNLNQDLEQAL